MKYIGLTLLLILVLHLPTNAQTPYWTDDFNTSQGWTLDSNWTIANGILEFYWSPTITNFDLSATSPVITLPENVQDLIVNQYLDAFESGTTTEAAEISVIINGEPQVLWTYQLINGNWGQSTGTDLIFEIGDYAGMDAQIRFRTYGPSTFQWDLWDVFNVKITALYASDLAITNITGPAAINPDESGQWEISLKNLGSEPQSDFLIKLVSLKYNNLIASLNISESILPQETKVYNIVWTPETAYNTVLRAEVIKEGDQYLINNQSKGQFVRIKPNVEFSVLLWDYDNSIETITDPELCDAIQPSTGLERALDAAGIDYTFVNYLPNNLDDYDMIFSTMGCYCVD